MNIMNRLTLRHLKKNRRRTLVTIIGVIISVAMVSAVSTLFVSFLGMMKQEAIQNSGDWHVIYRDVSESQMEAIRKDEQTEKLFITKDRGYAPLESPSNKNRPYLFIKEFDSQGMEHYPVELSEGRLPKKENEVLFPKEIMEKQNYQIGDEITLEIGERHIPNNDRSFGQGDYLQYDETEVIETLNKKEEDIFTIAGTIERPEWEPYSAPGYTIVSYMEQDAFKGGAADIGVTLKKVNRSLYAHAKELAEKNGITKVSFNKELLRYYGVTDNDNLAITLYSLAAIIILIIIIGSVSLIYNSFAISVSERARHLGMLSSVGATKTQKRNSVFFEGAVIGVISIPLGLLAGIGGILATFLVMNRSFGDTLGIDDGLTLTVTPMSILLSCLISILTIFISTYMPARKASKVSAIDAIRQSQDVKLTGKAVKTSRFVRKIFGLEAEIGLKNLKRNKRRYQVTVFSLVITIVLFLAVSYFTANLKQSITMTQVNYNYDVQIYSSEDQAALEPYMNLNYVSDASLMEEAYFSTWINESKLPDEVKAQDYYEDMLQDGKYPYSLVLHGIDEKSFKTYADKIGADVNELQDKVIILNKFVYEEEQTGKKIETDGINGKPGDKMDLYLPEENRSFQSLEIGFAAVEAPMGILPLGNYEVHLLMPQKQFEQLKQDGVETAYNLFLDSSKPEEMQDQLDQIESENLMIQNVYQNRERDEQMVTFMSVFTYGFITLISAISIANIFNTISTSIALRGREFAMLRSIGMTPKGFNKMINYESIFYGLKALLYGLPISLGVMLLMYWSLQNTFQYSFAVPWMSVLIAIAAIFIIVSAAMLYSIQKVKKQNIIDGLKQENI
ncbi:FtsX-like permease family protein [Bacillus infantis]|uniref:ABC transporter permease n=1 Tax=Bacillus infantis TaxID=324767 RepID=UPI001CD5B8D5|nr:FtsX-like permease family protein [Bacillus infantis]MCA1042227.1 FtsX-like permease family protein [Bacillus infantis]